MRNVVTLSELRSIKERFTFAGKKGIVTGAAGGIGQTTAAALAELGADVALVDLKLDKAKENALFIAKKYGVKTLAVKADVSNPDDVKAMLSEILSSFDVIDVVHSNAGIIAGDDNGDMPFESWTRMVEINYTGMFLVNQAVCTWMRDNNHPGAIVNTASMSGHIINHMRGENRHNVAYTSTKAAIVNLTKAMAVDFVKYGIRVNSISPGYMYSGIHDGLPQKMLDDLANADVPMARFGSMDEIGGVVAFLLSDLATYITGADILVDGGYTIW